MFTLSLSTQRIDYKMAPNKTENLKYTEPSDPETMETVGEATGEGEWDSGEQGPGLRPT